MNLEVLIATMKNDDISGLLDRMNINSNSVVINQTDYYDFKKINHKTYSSKVFSVDERGLSRSRNLAIIESTADLICLADDDMEYTDTYANDIISEFNKHPDADAILFYVKPVNGRVGNTKIKRTGRLKPLEYKEFCSVEIVIKRERLLAVNVWFNLLFGSGAKYKCGEETILLSELLKKGFKIYKSDVMIATVDMSESSWFTGFNEEFFYNKGAVVKAIYPRVWVLAIIVLSLKNSLQKLNGLQDFNKIFGWYYQGAKGFKGN